MKIKKITCKENQDIADKITEVFAGAEFKDDDDFNGKRGNMVMLACSRLSIPVPEKIELEFTLK